MDTKEPTEHEARVEAELARRRKMTTPALASAVKADLVLADMLRELLS